MLGQTPAAVPAPHGGLGYLRDANLRQCASRCWGATCSARRAYWWSAFARVLPPPAAKAPGTTYLLSPPLADPTAAPTIAGAGSPRSLAVLASHCSLVSSGGASIITRNIWGLSSSRGWR